MSEREVLRNAFENFNNGIVALESTFNRLTIANRNILKRVLDEKSELLRLLDEITEAYRNLEERYRQLLNRSISRISDLQAERDYLRLIIVEHTEDVDQTVRQLRDELEVVRSQFALQDEMYRDELQDQANQHREEIRQFEAKREREIAEYKKIIAKLTEKALSENVKKVRAKIIAKTSQVYDNRRKNKKNDDLTQKWPDLNILKTEDPTTKVAHQQPTNDNNLLNSNENICIKREKNVVETEKEFSKQRKRKLFCEDQDMVFDITPRP